MKEVDNKIMQTPYSDGSRISRSRTLWVLLFVALLIIIGVFVLITKNGQHSSFPKADQEHGTVFQGMSSLISSGLTSNQVNALSKAFEKYSPNAQVVVIDSKSLSLVPHNRYSTSTSDTINFQVAIDNKAYSAKLEYSNLTTVRLYLYDLKTGILVYDSGSISS